MITSADLDRESKEIADAAYNKLRDVYGFKMESYRAVRKQVRELIQEVGNPHAVAVAVDTTVDHDKRNFGPWSCSSSWVGRLVRDARVPYELWEYERWLRGLAVDDQRFEDGEFWLAIWRDAHRAGAKAAADRARAKLAGLKNADPERLTVQA